MAVARWRVLVCFPYIYEMKTCTSCGEKPNLTGQAKGEEIGRR